MSHAITRCPQCQTRFRVTEEQLRIADGSVRCGACLNVFQAEEHFISPLLDVTEVLAIQADYWRDFESWVMGEEVPVFNAPKKLYQFQEPAGAEEQADQAEDRLYHEIRMPPAGDEQAADTGAVVRHWQPPVLDEDMQEVAARSVTLTGFVHADESWHGEGLDGDFEFNVDHHQPGIEHHPHTAARRGGLLWFSGCLAMLILGALQFAWFQMDTYAQQAEYRGYYLEACRYLQCDVPEYRNADDLLTRELLVRSHPDEPDALVVDVLLRNTSPFRQEFPGLRMQFFDLQGEVVASRVFRVGEYLGGELRGLRYIPARTEVRLSLELVDPGRDALGYELQVVGLR